MEDSKKKPIMVGVIVACLILAVVVTVKTQTDDGGIPTDWDEQLEWAKCRKPDCEAEYEINKKYYYEYIKENRVGLSVPPLPCEQCGEDTLYKAFKCTNPDCELIFEAGSMGMADREDRCPKCKRSESEEAAKRFREEMKAKNSE